MNVLFNNPRRSNWKVYYYPEETYRAENPPRYNVFRGTRREAYTVRNDHDVYERKQAPQPAWERDNFIFEERMQFDNLGWKGRAYFVTLPTEGMPDRHEFSPTGWETLLNLIKQDKFTDEGRLIVSGTFTFKKQGSVLFTMPYVQEVVE